MQVLAYCLLSNSKRSLPLFLVTFLPALHIVSENASGAGHKFCNFFHDTHW